MQLVIECNEPFVLEFEVPPSAGQVKHRIYDHENFLDDLTLTLDGLSIRDDEIIPTDTLSVRAHVTNAVCGGKGGFGGLLKSMAKQKGKTKTLDYGACRDLNGRRLRHINDEILLTKWKEAKDKGEEFDVEAETATGIDMWYLSLPSWADGVKVDKRKRFLKPRLKTVLCLDWLRARQDGAQPPPKAPDFWGCPRGPRCEFAHGEEELRGQALKKIQDDRAQEKRDELTQKQDAYMDVMHRAEKNDEELNDLVLAGLRAAKKAKVTASKGETAEKSNTTSEPTQAVEEPSEEVNSVDAAYHLLTTLDKGVKIDLDLFAVQGNSTFGTVFAPHCKVVRPGRYYYEVELLSEGLMQIGWYLMSGDKSNASAVSGSSTEGEGVGDDDHSWSYDGMRQMLLHKGETTMYGPESRECWKQGEVVGCYLEIIANSSSSGGGGNEVVMSFSLNGAHFGEAFRCTLPLLLSERGSFLVPAVSLEQTEKVGLNLGQATFRHYQPLSSSSSSSSGGSNSAKGGQFRSFVPVWQTIAADVLEANGYTAEVAPAAREEEEEYEKSVKITSVTASNAPTIDYADVALESEEFSSVLGLENLGLDHLKHELVRRGLKSGGTLKERAERLFSVRGVAVDQIDKKLLSKK